MKDRIAVAFVAATLVSGAAFAAPATKRESIRVDRQAVLGTTVIEPGTYQLELIPGRDAVRLVQGKQTVAEAPCTVGLLRPVYPGTAVHYRTGATGPDRLVKIEFADSKFAIEFPVDTAATESAAVGAAAGRP